jgi:RimJ/RimL family protein N-acetyltransferase
VRELREDVRLTPLAPEHAANMLRWMQDPVVRKNIGLRSEPTLRKTREWIARALRDTSVAAFAIVLDGRHVGNVILDRRDDYLSSMRLSVYVGEPDARSAGVGSTAIHQALCHAFRNQALHKVWLTVHARNDQALKAYERLGFVIEGVLRDEFLLDGERVPALYMGLLRDEFERRAAASHRGTSRI